MNDANWESLTDVFDRLEAEMVKAALEAEGIPVVLSQGDAGNVLPVTFGNTARIEVFVPRVCLEQARTWLYKYEQGAPDQHNSGGSMDDTVILIANNGMGRADESLQQALMGKYFELLLQGGSLPNAICFYTEGVKLVIEGSPVLESLHSLEAQGVRLVVCSTCLNYFGLQDKVKAGVVGGMGDILEAQVKAGKVITL